MKRRTDTYAQQCRIRAESEARRAAKPLIVTITPELRALIEQDYNEPAYLRDRRNEGSGYGPDQ